MLLLFYLNGLWRGITHALVQLALPAADSACKHKQVQSKRFSERVVAQAIYR